MSKLINNLRKLFSEGPIGVYFMAFFIPLSPKMLGVAVALIIVEQLIRRPKIDLSYLKSQFSWRNPGIWILGFYLLHLVGLIHSENMKFANMDLGMKASLGVLPLFFMLYSVKVNWKLFVKVFIIGAFISILYNVYLSSEVFLRHLHVYYISGEHLSHLMHRGYWAVYLILAYFFLLKLMIESENKKSFFLNLTGALIMIAFVFLSGSKVGFILLFFVSIWAVISLFKKFNNKWILPVSIAVLAVGIASVFYLAPSITGRLNLAINSMNASIDSFDKEHPESTASRIMVWDSSLELIKENFWWGVGTGDIKDELIQRNFDKGYTGVAKQKLNSHNQFFNSHIALGIFGSLFLLLSIVTSYLKRKPDNYRAWRIGIISILCVALLPESMLETQAGIIPYAFFISFLPSFLPQQRA
ncbi:O-antigen ligase family protein [Brumimicrobium mesophilum]|uniref:O-antigen ligase family protein n=1 Tax=Brumimicrobium mesophilum TaxID=392717 RepID=UPI000D142C1B|nr:O-antigen ligase family protein [Brumimicrobium mesophilum]